MNASTGDVRTLAGAGLRAASRDGAAAQAMFLAPAGLIWQPAAGGGGVLYVADDTAVRVVRTAAARHLACCLLLCP